MLLHNLRTRGGGVGKGMCVKRVGAASLGRLSMPKPRSVFQQQSQTLSSLPRPQLSGHP